MCFQVNHSSDSDSPAELRWQIKKLVMKSHMMNIIHVRAQEHLWFLTSALFVMRTTRLSSLHLFCTACFVSDLVGQDHNGAGADGGLRGVVGGRVWVRSRGWQRMSCLDSLWVPVGENTQFWGYSWWTSQQQTSSVKFITAHCTLGVISSFNNSQLLQSCFSVLQTLVLRERREISRSDLSYFSHNHQGSVRCVTAAGTQVCHHYTFRLFRFCGTVWKSCFMKVFYNWMLHYSSVTRDERMSRKERNSRRCVH